MDKTILITIVILLAACACQRAEATGCPQPPSCSSEGTCASSNRVCVNNICKKSNTRDLDITVRDRSNSSQRLPPLTGLCADKEQCMWNSTSSSFDCNCEATSTSKYGKYCECMDNECCFPPSVTNGDIKKASNPTSFYVECNNGYELETPMSVLCTGGQWSNIPTCKPVDCGAAGIPDNGRLVFTTGTTFQSIRLFECYLGFLMVGASSVRCLGDGTWTELPICEAIVLTPCSNSLNINSSFTNVALNASVEISSLYVTATPTSGNGSFIIDENNSTFMHTLHQCYPYAIADLGDTYTIYSIYIHNRETHRYRLRRLVVSIGEDKSRLTEVARRIPAVAVGCALQFNKPYRGRFVKILLEANEFLHIAELNVYSII